MTGILLSIILLLGGTSGPTGDDMNTANGSALTTQTASVKHK